MRERDTTRRAHVTPRTDADFAEALRRLRARGTMTLAEALLRQRAVAGMGNVYKSETLFLCRVDPFATIESYEDATLERVVSTATCLMRADLENRVRGRTPRDAPRVRAWVYRRSGQPCRRCGTRIRMQRLGMQRLGMQRPGTQRPGDLGPATYFCPHCQGVQVGSYDAALTRGGGVVE